MSQSPSALWASHPQLPLVAIVQMGIMLAINAISAAEVRMLAVLVADQAHDRVAIWALGIAQTPVEESARCATSI